MRLVGGQPSWHNQGEGRGRNRRDHAMGGSGKRVGRRERWMPCLVVVVVDDGWDGRAWTGSRACFVTASPGACVGHAALCCLARDELGAAVAVSDGGLLLFLRGKAMMV